MDYVLVLVIGVVGGAVLMLTYFWDWRKKVQKQSTDAERRLREAAAQAQAANTKEQELSVLLEDAKKQAAIIQHRIVTFDELLGENAILKRDLQNVDVNLNKLLLDGELRDKRQTEVDSKSTQLARRYLAETVKQVVASVGPSNFSACKRRLLDVIERCREIGFDVPASEESSLMADLRREFETAVRAEFERQEQARIKAQIREEERLKREIDRELKQQERERLAIQAALDQAMAAARGQFSAEVEALKARLAEAEEKSKRTMSMAQQTKAGHVYVISNIGAFGLGVFKIGMTRRLIPKERVDELGSASVPFPFDVHMMIGCRNAPELENALHRALRKRRVNRANPRKEFFRATIDEIHEIVLKHHGEVRYMADPEALEYNQSLTMPEEDAEIIEAVYEKVEEEQDAVGDEE